MYKVVVVNVHSQTGISTGNSPAFFEFDLDKVNNYLNEGWKIIDKQVVPSSTASCFSIIYTLGKSN